MLTTYTPAVISNVHADFLPLCSLCSGCRSCIQARWVCGVTVPRCTMGGSIRPQRPHPALRRPEPPPPCSKQHPHSPTCWRCHFLAVACRSLAGSPEPPLARGSVLGSPGRPSGPSILAPRSSSPRPVAVAAGGDKLGRASGGGSPGGVAAAAAGALSGLAAQPQFGARGHSGGGAADAGIIVADRSKLAALMGGSAGGSEAREEEGSIGGGSIRAGAAAALAGAWASPAPGALVPPASPKSGGDGSKAVSFMVGAVEPGPKPPSPSRPLPQRRK